MHNAMDYHVSGKSRTPLPILHNRILTYLHVNANFDLNLVPRPSSFMDTPSWAQLIPAPAQGTFKVMTWNILAETYCSP